MDGVELFAGEAEASGLGVGEVGEDEEVDFVW